LHLSAKPGGEYNNSLGLQLELETFFRVLNRKQRSITNKRCARLSIKLSWFSFFQWVIVNRALRISRISPRNLQDLIVSIDESASPSRFDERPDGDAADEERAAASKRQKFLFP